MKLAIVIPVYNCEPVIHQVVESVLAVRDEPLFVVDDGSNPVLKLSTESLQVQIIRNERNLGKGASLQKAMKLCREQDFTHMLVMDGDGQHLAKDIESLVRVACEDSKALVIGCRIFQEGVPRISKFGRNFSNFWVRYQTGIKVSDSQSGMRLYPLKELANIKYFTKRYDFEIEVLVRALWKGVLLKEVEIDVHYPKEDERISHFHKFKDNARITFLNILLITYSLLFYRRELWRLLVVAVAAQGLALLNPIWLGMFWGAVTCVFLRLNFIFMVFTIFLLRCF